MKKLLIVLVAVLLSALISPQTSSAEVLEFESNPRAYGMGKIGTAGLGDPQNLFFNPAALSTIGGAMAHFNRVQLVPYIADDVYFISLGGAGKIKDFETDRVNVRIAGSLSYAKLDFGEWELTDPGGASLGTYSAYEKYIAVTTAISATFRRTFHLGAGFSFKPYTFQLGPAWTSPDQDTRKTTGNAFDFGVIAGLDLLTDSGFNFFPSVGLGFLNYGDKVEFSSTDYSYDLPGKIRIGAGLRIESPGIPEIDKLAGKKIPSLTLSLGYDRVKDRVNDLSDENRFGMDIDLFHVFFMRWGQVKREHPASLTFWGLGLGLPLKRFTFRLDYARIPQQMSDEDVNYYGFVAGMTY